METAKSQARLIEAIERFDSEASFEYPDGPEAATLSQVRDAHNRYEGFGETGEFTLSKRIGDEMVFLLRQRHSDLENPQPVPWNSELAEPMRRALSGQSGTVVGLDYRGERVLAAHEPVKVLGLGIVAKIDLAEVRAPFLRAAAISGLVGLLLVAAGSAIFLRVTNPLIERLTQTVGALQGALEEVQTLSGLLPICAACKKIRDDQGYWQQIESYVGERSEAEFSHSICPDCTATLYPEVAVRREAAPPQPPD